MSVSRVVLPVLDLEQNDDPLNKVALKGAKQLSVQNVEASSISNDSVSFSFQPPSQNTVLDRRIDLVMKVVVKAPTGGSFLRKNHLQSDVSADDAVTRTSNCAFPSNRIIAGSLAQAFTGTPIASITPALVDGDAATPAGDTAADVKAALNTTLANIEARFVTMANPITPAGTYLASFGSPVASKRAAVETNYALIANNLALRQMPLASIIESIDLTINGTHFTSDVSSIIKPLLQYTEPEYRQEVLKESYHHPDTCAGNYKDTLKNDSQTTFTTALDIDDNKGRAGESPRGAFWKTHLSDDEKVSNPTINAAADE